MEVQISKWTPARSIFTTTADLAIAYGRLLDAENLSDQVARYCDAVGLFQNWMKVPGNHLELDSEAVQLLGHRGVVACPEHPEIDSSLLAIVEFVLGKLSDDRKKSFLASACDGRIPAETELSRNLHRLKHSV